MAKRLDPSDNPLQGMRDRMFREATRSKIQVATSMVEIDERIEKENEAARKEEIEDIDLSVVDELIRAPLEASTVKQPEPKERPRKRKFEDHFNRETFYLEKDLSVELRALQDMMREKNMTPFINKLLRGVIDSDTNKRRLKDYKRMFGDRYKELLEKYS